MDFFGVYAAGRRQQRRAKLRGSVQCRRVWRQIGEDSHDAGAHQAPEDWIRMRTLKALLRRTIHDQIAAAYGSNQVVSCTQIHDAAHLSAQTDHPAQRYESV